jgi:hypothetical protein
MLIINFHEQKNINRSIIYILIEIHHINFVNIN